MKRLQLLPVGNPDAGLLEWLRQALADKFHVPAEILVPPLDPAFTLHAERQQFHSSEILGAMQKYVTRDTWRLLGVSERDLYIPILTFVFGEAQMGGPGAIVSYRRLTQEFYGLPPDLDVLANRLLIESVHELGHTLHLTHCQEYRCAMSSSHAVEYIDIKDSGFCEDCLAKAMQVV
ncbi:MAG TPA: archaemetzincin [Candidatus Angelobacter sp.]|nr:archaemetzincin [Candidatus Angelobacter sp.]